jgi:hypothetical protein
MHRGDDADVLEQAAEVIRRRSRRPDGLMARILLKVLEDTATNIRRGKL